MSFSFTVRAADKAGAKAAVAAQLEAVVGQQPIHAVDAADHQAAADRAIERLADDPTHDVVVAVAGSLGWRGALPEDEGTAEISSANSGVTAWLARREPETAEDDAGD